MHALALHFHPRARRRSLHALCALSLAGCVNPAPDSAWQREPDVEVAALPLIAGFPADSPEFDAIGAITTATTSLVGSARRNICTGTLIAPTRVVTAKHCTLEQRPLYFAIGPDGAKPKREFEVVAIERAPDAEDVHPARNGHDVAVLHLAEPVPDIAPLAYRQLTDDDVGKPFTSMGYGVRDTTRASGSRRMAQTSLRARKGLGFEAALGSFDGFYAHFLDALRRRGTTCRQHEAREEAAQLKPAAPVVVPEPKPAEQDEGCSPEYLQKLQEIYDNFELESDGQVLVGSRLEGQTCFGDSGGPLLKPNAEGALETYGVVSWGIDSADLPCDYGTFFSTFASPKLELLEQAEAWVDPCGGVSSAGECVDEVATRCTSLSEGPRRLLTLDCASVGQDCQERADGRVGCGDAGPALEPKPVGSPPPVAVTLPPPPIAHFAPASDEE